MASFLRITLENPEQLSTPVRLEFEQLITALQRWSQNPIPAELIPVSDLAIPAAQITGILPPAHGGTGLDGSGVADGSLLIGSHHGFALAPLTAGSGITITSGPGSIIVAASGGGGTGGAQYMPATVGGLCMTLGDDLIAIPWVVPAS